MIVTNMLGVAFAATLLSASDAGVTFVFPEDGATNTLAWAQLDLSSQDAVCEAAGFAPVPPELAATFRIAKKELLRLDAFEADNRIEPAEIAARRAAVRKTFKKKCGEKGLPYRRTDLLLRRL